MIELTSKQRKILEKEAHDLNPLVIIGGNGITETVEKQIDRCLDDHELIKVRFNEFKEEAKPLTEEVAEKIDATVVRVIGFTAILFRQSSNEDKRKNWFGKKRR